MSSVPPSVHRVAVIMAGGSGERFWPLSRVNRPKQLLKLTSKEETLLQESVNRLLPIIPADRIFVATTKILRDAIIAAELGIPAENILAEPARRNTAGCLCWVATQLRTRFGAEADVAIAVLTADHMIGRPDHFRERVVAALDVAEYENGIVTLGVRPVRPETGYGYIEVDPETTGDENSRRVVRFREKPNQSLAEDFVASGHFFWNSGMFFWRLSTFESSIQSASPQHGDVLKRMNAALSAGSSAEAEKAFCDLPDISIDYALLERANNVLMLEATFPWDDVGAWDALDRSRKHDAEGNIAEGATVLIDTRDSIVVNASEKNDIAVGVVGLKDVIVIVSDDAVLVVSKEHVQDVRHVPRELRRRGAPQV